MKTQNEIALEAAVELEAGLWLESKINPTPVTMARLADARARIDFLQDEVANEEVWFELV